MIHPLVEAIRSRDAILFVGAGVSMNVGLPSWSRLIDEIAEKVNYDPEIFKTMGDYLALAEYYHGIHNSLDKLRSFMDVEWHSGDKRDRVVKSPIYKQIVELNFPIIYTTNYDRYLEWAFESASKPFLKVTDVKHLVRVDRDATQIVKFHGDFDDDKSLVLTESSYFERFGFETPMDIKLRADALGKTILFIGYSFNDLNIRYMFYRMHQMWRASSFASARPRSYIFLARPNAVQEAVLKNWGIEAVVSDVDDPGEGLERFLNRLCTEVR